MSSRTSHRSTRPAFSLPDLSDLSASADRPTGPDPAPRTNTFDCVSCGLTVTASAPDGGRRNHCPGCLHSRHVEDRVDGGQSDCGSRMTPISVAVLRDGAWTIVHRCTRCDELTSTPVSPDDNQLVLMRTAVRPLAQPPFPLEVFGAL